MEQPKTVNEDLYTDSYCDSFCDMPSPLLELERLSACSIVFEIEQPSPSIAEIIEKTLVFLIGDYWLSDYHRMSQLNNAIG